MAPRHPVSDCVWNIWKFKPFFLYGNSFVFDTYATQKPDAILSRPGDPHTSICQILIQIFAAGDPAPLFLFLSFSSKSAIFDLGNAKVVQRFASRRYLETGGTKKRMAPRVFIFQNLVLFSLFFEWLFRISEIRNQNAVYAETSNFHFDLVPQKRKKIIKNTHITHVILRAGETIIFMCPPQKKQPPSPLGC